MKFLLLFLVSSKMFGHIPFYKTIKYSGIEKHYTAEYRHLAPLNGLLDQIIIENIGKYDSKESKLWKVCDLLVEDKNFVESPQIGQHLRPYFYGRLVGALEAEKPKEYILEILDEVIPRGALTEGFVENLIECSVVVTNSDYVLHLSRQILQAVSWQQSYDLKDLELYSKGLFFELPDAQCNYDEDSPLEDKMIEYTKRIVECLSITDNTFQKFDSRFATWLPGAVLAKDSPLHFDTQSNAQRHEWSKILKRELPKDICAISLVARF